MEDDAFAACALCDNDRASLLWGWYGFDRPLCPSCRRVVVLKHDKENPKLFPWSGENYAHAKLYRGDGSQKQLFVGYEARPTPASFAYYRSVLAYIKREAARTPQERAKYGEVAQAHSNLYSIAGATTAPLSGIPATPTRTILDEMQEKKENRQLSLFADFPPK